MPSVQHLLHQQSQVLSACLLGRQGSISSCLPCRNNSSISCFQDVPTSHSPQFVQKACPIRGAMAMLRILGYFSVIFHSEISSRNGKMLDALRRDCQIRTLGRLVLQPAMRTWFALHRKISSIQAICTLQEAQTGLRRFSPHTYLWQHTTSDCTFGADTPSPSQPITSTYTVSRRMPAHRRTARRLCCARC